LTGCLNILDEEGVLRAWQDPTNQGTNYLSSNISDVRPIIDPPPRPIPRGPNRLA
jgi:hypothetical protein